MAECECLPKCPFFHDRMENMPALANMMKNRYCLGDSTECARHMVFLALGREMVPGNLFPSQTEKAHELIGVAHSKH